MLISSTDQLVHPNLEGDAELLSMAEARWGIPTFPPPDHYFGRVALGTIPIELSSSLSNESLTHPDLPTICNAMQIWPDGWRGFQELVTHFWPLAMNGVPEGSKGCSSGHNVLPTYTLTREDGSYETHGWRAVYVTLFSVIGAREGLYHEYAHLRLEAMGVDLETHSGLLLENNNNPIHVSPVRKDIRRPMSAVLHGHYAWLTMSHADVLACEAGDSEVLDLIKQNVCKLEEGFLTITQRSLWTSEGSAFCDSLLSWTEAIVARMWNLIPLDEHGDVREAHEKWVKSCEVSQSPLYE